MFTIDRSMTAEIDYRNSRIKGTWSPRRKGLKAVGQPGRRLHAGSRQGVFGVGGGIAAAR